MIDKWIEHIVQVSMVVFPVSPYFNQYLKLKTSNQGFSLHVCGGLMLSNIFKIFFWYCKRFDVTILVQGITMFAVQLWLLAVSKSTMRIKRRFPYNDIEVLGIFVYLCILTIQLIVLIICQYTFGTEPLYVETIGFLGVFLEAAVPGFQVFRNFRNQSVKGFSELVLLVWFTGDICKIGYHLYFRNPIQFVLCGLVQVSFDLILFYQFYKYNKGIYLSESQPDEHRRLLNEDPNDYYPNFNRYSYTSPSSSSLISNQQFEAKPSHQRYLTEGTVHENAYDEAVMDPKPNSTNYSKPYYEEPNSSYSVIHNNNNNNKNSNKNNNNKNNFEINIQEDECPPENDSILNSFHNSLKSFRSYQYANIRTSNHHFLQNNTNTNSNTNINTNTNNTSNTSININEENDPINSILSIKRQAHANAKINSGRNEHELHRKSSILTYSSHNSSINNDLSILYGSIISFHSDSIPDPKEELSNNNNNNNTNGNGNTSNINNSNTTTSTTTTTTTNNNNKSLNRSKSVQLPRIPSNLHSNMNNYYNSKLQRSNSQRNTRK